MSFLVVALLVKMAHQLHDDPFRALQEEHVDEQLEQLLPLGILERGGAVIPLLGVLKRDKGRATDSARLCPGGVPRPSGGRLPGHEAIAEHDVGHTPPRSWRR